LNHFSLVILVVAYILGLSLGFRETGLVVAEGNTQDIGHNTGLSLKLVSFVDEYYPDGTPKDYRSQVVLYENGKQIEETSVRVNHPLTHKGVRIFQSFFGPAANLSITQNGTSLYNGSVALDQENISTGVPLYEGIIDLPGGLRVLVFSPIANMPTTVMPAGNLAIEILQNNQPVGMDLVGKGATVEIGNLNINYQEEAKFSGFQVSRDPANPLIWIGSSILILGLILTFYFPHRQVWLFLQNKAPGGTRLVLRMGAPRGIVQKTELNSLKSSIENELSLRKDS
jgi:cytochrome c biogenesis protein